VKYSSEHMKQEKSYVFQSDSSGDLTLKDLPDGKYELSTHLSHIEGNPLAPLVAEPSQKMIVKVSAGEVKPSKIHCDLTLLRVSFSANDQSLPECSQVRGTFTPKDGSNTLAIKGSNDARGKEQLPMPEGQVTYLSATCVQNGEEIKVSRSEPIDTGKLQSLQPTEDSSERGKKQGPMRLHIATKPSSFTCEAARASEATSKVASSIFAKRSNEQSDGEEEQEPIQLHMATEATSFGLEAKWVIDDTTKTIVMVDISKSMRKDDRLESMKRSLRRTAESIVIQGGKFAFVAWDSRVEFEDKSGKWKSNVSDDIADWIDELKERGGNDMRHALEQSLGLYKDATDVWVMCDGDVSPFCLEGGIMDCRENVPQPESAFVEACMQPYNNTNWKSFRDRFPDVRFNFISFSEEGDRISMQKMARLGGGFFSQYALRKTANSGTSTWKDYLRGRFPDGACAVFRLRESGKQSVLLGNTPQWEGTSVKANDLLFLHKFLELSLKKPELGARGSMCAGEKEFKVTPVSKAMIVGEEMSTGRTLFRSMRLRQTMIVAFEPLADLGYKPQFLERFHQTTTEMFQYGC